MDVPLDVLEKKKNSIKDPEKIRALESDIDDLNNVINSWFN